MGWDLFWVGLTFGNNCGISWVQLPIVLGLLSCDLVLLIPT